MTFRTIVADPPWPYKDRISSGKAIRGAGNHYGLMTLDELAELPVPAWADPEGAHLYVWTTNAFLVEAHLLAQAWGFMPKTVLTWIKLTQDGRKAKIGMGRTFRGTTEHVIFAVRGRLPVLRHDVPTHFAAPAGAHSAKPDRFYTDVVQAMSPGPYLEMFARARRRGWVVWGEEAPGRAAESGADEIMQASDFVLGESAL